MDHPTPPAPAHLFCVGFVTGGWKRDLLREGVEPNPGPTMEKVLKSLRSELGKKAADFEEEINELEQRIQEAHGDDLVMHEDVRTFLTERSQEINDIFGEKRASQILQLLHEVLPKAGSPPASTRASSGLVGGGELALPVGFFDDVQMLKRDEGIFGTPWAIRRDNLCKAIRDIVDGPGRGLMLVCGPFGSGKTALASLLQYYLRENGEIAYAISLAGVKEFKWRDAWLNKTEVEWERIIKTKRRVYVIIDEVQLSYPTTNAVNNLWDSVKDATVNNSVHFVLIGSYGDIAQTPIPSTLLLLPPIALHPHNGTPGLRYTEDEFTNLCNKFQEYCKSIGLSIEIDQPSRNYIYHLTDGHPGFVGHSLRCIYRKQTFQTGKSMDSLYMTLHSASFHSSFQHERIRSMPQFEKSEYMNEIRQACMHILSQDSFQALFESFQNLKGRDYCLQTSLFVKTGDYVMFSSPIVRNRALAQFFSKTQVDPASLDAFIISLIQCFSARQLCNTVSKDNKSRIMEGQWQQEFLRTAASFLPRNAIISLEYGREEQVDFFIAKYGWLIQVTCDGLAMSEHLRHFEPGGRYEGLLIDRAEKWAVIDFRSVPKEARQERHPNLYRVIFDDQCTSFTILGPGERTRMNDVFSMIDF